jgi:hypothetical protein
MTAHTQGPWVVVDDLVVRAQERTICICPSGATAADPLAVFAESKANARLIAAAHDLYVIATHPVLEHIILESDNPNVKAIFEPMRRAAIAKAEGKS